MIFIRYHPIGAYKQYDFINKKVHISIYVVFHDSEAWKWQTKDRMEGEVKHIYVNYDQNEKSNDETNVKDTRVGEVAQIESHTH